MNKSGVWKSLEVKAEEEKKKTSKDGSPDGGIVINIDKRAKADIEDGNDDETKSLVSNNSANSCDS